MQFRRNDRGVYYKCDHDDSEFSVLRAFQVYKNVNYRISAG